jgi:O-antigen ligase
MATEAPTFAARWRANYEFWTLAGLLVAAFLFGGGGRDDILSLVVLRPLAAICLAIGLFGLTRGDLRQYRWVLAGAAALLLLILAHLIPLPPSIWTSLPGRELASQAAEVGGIAQPWRPLTLVPWRGWNSLYALLVPLAALVLAIRCTPRQREWIAYVILALILLAALWAIVQVAGGYRKSLYLYRITNENLPTGLFSNRNHFAAMLACAVPLMAVLVARYGRSEPYGSLRLWLTAAAAAGGLLLLLMTGSRAGLFVALVALACLPWVYPSGSDAKTAKRRRQLIIAAGAVAVLLVTALALYLSRAQALDRLRSTGETEEARFEVWGPIARLIGEYFPWGSGIGSFVEVWRIHEPRQLLDGSYLNHAHSDWLEWPMEMGLPGMLLLAVAIGAWVWRTIQLARLRPRRDTGVVVGRAGAVIVLVLGLASLVDYPIRVPSVAAVLAIAVVWMASAIGAKPSDAVKAGSETQHA